MSDWYSMDSIEVVERLDSDLHRGLSRAEAAVRRAQYGPNELVEQGQKSRWLILWEQFASTMVIILAVAAAISVFLGDYKDAGTIAAIVVLNTVLGFTQEYRAEKAMAALKQLAVPVVKVRRDGSVTEVSARELVPGDIVLLEAGSLLPADCRLLETANLRVQEAVLTGESEPVEKVSRHIAGENLPLGDRRNMGYMGTSVSYGRGVGIVTETGMATELGRIATLIQTVGREPTPLQRRLDQLGKRLAAIAVVIVAVVFAFGLLRGEDLQLMFLTAVSMAVAAVPEGLPAVVTIALALGAQRMLKRNALIRKLPAVETLGSVTVICSDKTGTLTENRMTLTVLAAAGGKVDLIELMHGTTPTVSAPPTAEAEDEGRRGQREGDDGMPWLPGERPGIGLLLVGGALCNDATLRVPEGEKGHLHAVGDPTEGALVVAAARLGLWKDKLEEEMPRVAEVPFDSDRKRMTTIHKLPECGTSNGDEGGRTKDESTFVLPPSSFVGSATTAPARYVAFAKGAVDSLLEVCTSVWTEGGPEPMGAKQRERILAANDKLAGDGMRVLGMAMKPLADLNGGEDAGSQTGPEVIERDLIFTGLVGMIDPARPEVKDAVLTCKAAGIRPVMITGDHPLTARHIARELEMLGYETKVADERYELGHIVTGQELDNLDEGALEEVVGDIAVYARVSPEHKLRIVQALQRRGQVVAMTGDGVNDAPALKKADIGVAMGITGTDVSKEAADMVLMDDNFATIVAAVKEGRVIYDNIRKFVQYLMATNSAEIWVMLIAPFIGMPLPLLPLQILWVNLLTDGLPALALAVEPAEHDTMRRSPYRPGESLLSRGTGFEILWVGLLMAVITLGTGYWYWRGGQSPQGSWQTVLFTVLALSQMANVLAVRSGRASLFQVGLLSNKAMLGAVAMTLLLQLMVIYVPVLQSIFSTVALSAADLAVALALSSIIFWAIELKKWVARRVDRD